MCVFVCVTTYPRFTTAGRGLGRRHFAWKRGLLKGRTREGSVSAFRSPPPTHYINVFYRAHGNRDTGALGSHLLQNLSCVRERGSLTCARKRSLSPAKTEEGEGQRVPSISWAYYPPPPTILCIYINCLPQPGSAFLLL